MGLSAALNQPSHCFADMVLDSPFYHCSPCHLGNQQENSPASGKSRYAFTFSAISDPQGEILQKLRVHISLRAELQHTFRKAINLHFYLIASGSII